jgi:hypothetical protein
MLTMPGRAALINPETSCLSGGAVEDLSCAGTTDAVLNPLAVVAGADVGEFV